MSGIPESDGDEGGVVKQQYDVLAMQMFLLHCPAERCALLLQAVVADVR